MERSISKRGTSRGSKWFGILFGTIFCLVGGGIFVFLTALPLVRLWSAQGWYEARCEILSSEVASHSDSDGTTYSIAITYAYEFNNRRYTSDRYGFWSGSSSGYESKQHVVNRYPPGSRSVCYVNPDDPSEAVLYRGFSFVYLIGCFGLIFVLVGLGVAWGTSRSARRATTPSTTFVHAPEIQSSQAPGPATHSTHGKPFIRFVGITIFALIWNAVTAGIMYAIVTDRGGIEWFGVLFVGLFQLIGFALIAGVFYAFLALFNPRMRVTLNPAELCLAESMEISWEFDGSTHRLSKFRIDLEGEEKATYRRGTDTHTDRHVFRTITVHETADRNEIRGGRVVFTMPEYTMHTFKASNNEIIWTLKVRGEIANWPDVSEEFVIHVRPLAIQPAVSGEGVENATA